ncbi:hypothetical protein FHG87_008863 [Trinorchestia longiramus]|nr:hypothetical protein FHG87_008863 [Trinorchestia longiramus]
MSKMLWLNSILPRTSGLSCVEEDSGMNYLLMLDGESNVIIVDAMKNFLGLVWNKRRWFRKLSVTWNRSRFHSYIIKSFIILLRSLRC